MRRSEAWVGSSLSASQQLLLPAWLLFGPDIGGLSSLSLQFLVPRFGDRLEGGHGSCSPGPFPSLPCRSLLCCLCCLALAWGYPEPRCCQQSGSAPGHCGLLPLLLPQALALCPKGGGCSIGQLWASPTLTDLLGALLPGDRPLSQLAPLAFSREASLLIFLSSPPSVSSQQPELPWAPAYALLVDPSTCTRQSPGPLSAALALFLECRCSQHPASLAVCHQASYIPSVCFPVHGLISAPQTSLSLCGSTIG